LSTPLLILGKAFDIIAVTSYLAHGQQYYAFGTLVSFLWTLDPFQVEGRSAINDSIGQGFSTRELWRYYSAGVVPGSLTGYLACVSVLATPIGSLSITTMLLRVFIAGFAFFITATRALQAEHILAQDVDPDDFYACKEAKVKVTVEDRLFLPTVLLGMPTMCSRLDASCVCRILFWFLACRVPFQHGLFCLGFSEDSVIPLAGIRVSMRVLYFALAYAMTLELQEVGWEKFGEVTALWIGTLCALTFVWMLRRMAEHLLGRSVAEYWFVGVPAQLFSCKCLRWQVHEQILVFPLLLCPVLFGFYIWLDAWRGRSELAWDAAIYHILSNCSAFAFSISSLLYFKMILALCKGQRGAGYMPMVPASLYECKTVAPDARVANVQLDVQPPRRPEKFLVDDAPAILDSPAIINRKVLVDDSPAIVEKNRKHISLK